MNSDIIFLTPYNEKWPEFAAREIAAIRESLPNLNFEIEHIGSTAIPHLSAKPIIDLLVGVDSLSDAEKFIEPLENRGYSYWRDNPKKWHFYFVKGLPLAGGNGRTHHIHIYERNHPDFYRKLLFRNYLRTHPESVKVYEDLKTELADKYSDDREKYTDAKTNFVEAIVASAELEISLHNIAIQIRQAKMSAGMTTKIIAIDGCGGAGKSTLAAMLSEKLSGCSVVHTDDFASWDNSQNWYPKMLTQVFEPLSKNRSAKFQRYDWEERKLSEWYTVDPQQFIIVEGVTSSRREFRPFLAFSLFVDADADLRLHRGLKRDGVQAKDQWLKWMREEDEYLARDNPRGFANAVISGNFKMVIE